MHTKLSVNLNKVALLRNQRDLRYPNVVEIARLAIAAGAEGITVHPRPDQRHIRPTDVLELRSLLRTEYDDRIEFNVEGNPTDSFLALVHEVCPTQVTLVPDTPEQRTSDHGWEIHTEGKRLAPLIADLASDGIRVSLFVEPAPETMSSVRTTGAHRIELYTARYAEAYADGIYDEVLGRYSDTAEKAVEVGLGVNAGHDLTLDNLPAFKRQVPMVAEVSIGHALIADALRMGLPATVKAYLAAIA